MPAIITAFAMVVCGAVLGAAMAASGVRAAARCRRHLAACVPNVLVLPGLLTLGVSGVRLLEHAAPGWRGEWRALALFSASSSYLWQFARTV